MIFNNPEFKKNIKLELSTTRLLIPAFMLALAAWIGWSTGDGGRWDNTPELYSNARSMTYWMFGFGFIFSIIWGSYLTSNSLFGEMRQKTWDFMRMSSLAPQKILFGKLFGATAVVWIISLFGILPVLILASQDLFVTGGYHRPAYWTLTSLFSSLIAWMILSYSFVMLASLYTYSRASRHTTIGAVILILVTGLFIGGMISSFYVSEFRVYEVCRHFSYVGQKGPMQCIVQNPYVIDGIKYSLSKIEMVDWYGLKLFPLDAFATNMIFAAFWTVVGLYRSLRDSLQYKDTPYVWVLFLLSTVIFISGFDLDGKAYAKMAFMFIAATMIPVCIKEAANRISYRKFYESLEQKKYKEALSLTPLWSISFLFFIISSPVIFMFFNKGFSAAGYTAFYVTVILYSIRDILAIHVISWRPSVRSPVVGIAVYFFLMYFLLPVILKLILGKNMVGDFGMMGQVGQAQLNLMTFIMLHSVIILILFIPFKKGVENIIAKSDK